MVAKSPNWDCGTLPNGRFMAYKLGVILTMYTSPWIPSSGYFQSKWRLGKVQVTTTQSKQIPLMATRNLGFTS